MRRKDKEITAIEEIIKIIDTCKVCRIAMIDENRPYIVPLNFGYTYKEGIIELYFHSALQGRKIDILKANPNVCIEMDCKGELQESDIACRNSYLFTSIIGEGETIFIEDTEEKKIALNELMHHMVGRKFDFEDRAVQSIAVFKVKLTSLSAKGRMV